MKRIILTLMVLYLFGANSYIFGQGIDEYTVLILHCDGAEGSTSFIDSSFSHHIITKYGNTHVDTSQKKFGSGSALFDGRGDFLSIPDHDDWYFGFEDFTIDFWIKTTQTDISFIGTQTDDGTEAIRLMLHPSNKFYFGWMDTNDSFHSLLSATSINDGQWYHIACVRYKNSLKLFINGTEESVKDITRLSHWDATSSLIIGRQGSEDIQYFDGRIDEFRISKGVTRWTSDFTPPSEAYIVPEPSTVLLFGLGLLGAGLIRRKIN